jgi:hypothetical protein
MSQSIIPKSLATLSSRLVFSTAACSPFPVGTNLMFPRCKTAATTVNIISCSSEEN